MKRNQNYIKKLAVTLFSIASVFTMSLALPAQAMAAPVTTTILSENMEDRDMAPFKHWGYTKPNFTGSYLCLSGTNGGYEYVMTAEPNTTYEISAWVYTYGDVRLGIKNSHELNTSFTKSCWENKSVTYTTGSTAQTLIFYLYIPANAKTTAYVDEILIKKTQDTSAGCPTYDNNALNQGTLGPNAQTVLWQNMDSNSVSPFKEWGYGTKKFEGGAGVSKSTALRITGDNGGYEYKLTAEPNTTYEMITTGSALKGTLTAGIKDTAISKDTFMEFNNRCYETKSVKFVNNSQSRELTFFLYAPIRVANDGYIDDIIIRKVSNKTDDGGCITANVTTGSPTRVDRESARICYNSFTGVDLSKVQKVGIMYGTTGGLDDGMVEANPANPFSIEINGLKPCTTYYYAAYIYANGYFFVGEVKSFNTGR